MRCLFDIAHPAHVHLFKHAVWQLKEEGNEVSVVARDKDITVELLNEYGFDYTCLSRMKQGYAGMLFELAQHEWGLYKVVRKFRPDIMVNVVGTFVAPVGFLLRIPTIGITDTEHASVTNKLTFPLLTKICTPSCYIHDVGKKQVRYEGYHELAYLHPNRFKPDSEVLKAAGLDVSDKFYIVRFVSWGAIHDKGHGGFSLEGKRKLIDMLSKKGRVIITSEAKLPDEFEKYRMSISPVHMHDFLYYSDLYIGEGGTMASEAAVLGTPAVFVSTLRLGYLDEQEEKYDMTYTISDETRALNKVEELINSNNLKETWSKKKESLIADKIDVTDYLVGLIKETVNKKKTV